MTWVKPDDLQKIRKALTGPPPAIPEELQVALADANSRVCEKCGYQAAPPVCTKCGEPMAEPPEPAGLVLPAGATILPEMTPAQSSALDSKVGGSPIASAAKNIFMNAFLASAPPHLKAALVAYDRKMRGIVDTEPAAGVVDSAHASQPPAGALAPRTDVQRPPTPCADRREDHGDAG